MNSKVRDEVLEVLNRDAPGSAAAWKSREVGSVQAKLQHAGFHSRGHVTGAGGVRRHREPSHCWLDALAQSICFGFESCIRLSISVIRMF